VSENLKTLVALTLGGLAIGLVTAPLAAGAYVAWRFGAPVTEITPLSYFEHGRTLHLARPEIFRPSYLAGLAGALAPMALLVGAGYRPRSTRYGDARWAARGDLREAGLLAAPGRDALLLAKLGSPRSRARFLASRDHPHVLVAAPTGAGKGVGVVIPNLLTWGGSVICLDVKGENFAKTARRRRAMQDRVFRFAPYDAEGRSHRYNPLEDAARIHNADRRFTEIRRLAAALIVPRGKSDEPFVPGARDLFAAASMLAIEAGTPTIGAVYRLLSASGEAGQLFAEYAEQARHASARAIFRRFSGYDPKTLSVFLSVAMDAGLGVWADPAVVAATSASDFDFGEFRRSPSALYVTVSPNDIEPLAPLIRLLFQQAVAILQRAEPASDEIWPVLLLVDEFRSLGRMDALVQAITTLRSYGVRVMLVTQNLANLEELYGRAGRDTILSNCAIKLFMSPGDEGTPAWLSRAIGDRTRERRTISKAAGQGLFARRTVSSAEEGARLIREEEITRLGADRLILLVQDARPVLARKIRYYEDRALRRLYEGQAGDLPEPERMHPEGSTSPAAKTAPSIETAAESIPVGGVSTEEDDALIDALTRAMAIAEEAEQFADSVEKEALET